MAGRGCYSVEKYQLPWCSNTELKIYHLSFFRHTLIATSTLLILAVCRTRVKYEPTIWPRSPTEFSVAQVDRAPARCLGDHRFESCRGHRFFLCPRLVTRWSFHFHICFTDFLRYRFWGLIFGGAYTWRGLLSEFYRIQIHYLVLLALAVPHMFSSSAFAALGNNRLRTSHRQLSKQKRQNKSHQNSPKSSSRFEFSASSCLQEKK